MVGTLACVISCAELQCSRHLVKRVRTEVLDKVGGPGWWGSLACRGSAGRTQKFVAAVSKLERSSTFLMSWSSCTLDDNSEMVDIISHMRQRLRGSLPLCEAVATMTLPGVPHCWHVPTYRMGRKQRPVGHDVCMHANILLVGRRRVGECGACRRSYMSGVLGAGPKPCKNGQQEAWLRLQNLLQNPQDHLNKGQAGA